MIDVKFIPKGVLVSLTNATNNKAATVLYNNPHELDKLIAQLQEAKITLAEHQSRSSEENQSQLWESI
jgi:hypothetical protein